ncbi:RteC domain-containing protein [Sphingobacterium multivorum]|uniref:RteC domain-containing protein n=1 Tax=Sphingobacterium multivorum TaxID=28454 RepID=UPI0021CEE9BA|nr:RteC domain-containing protein [Sphingobacterium multivorum]
MHELKKKLCRTLTYYRLYSYYRSDRTDCDHIYFKRGNTNNHCGLNSIVFEIDPEFFTFYDYKTTRIIANELLYFYLLTKINPEENPDLILQKPENSKDIFLTESKHALIELAYTLYYSASISHGKIGVRKISLMFQIFFGLPLANSTTLFIE